ncbi:MAG: hypothetical protein RR559_04440 [Bacteroides sp.]
MASSTDFKKIYDLYQLEGVKKGISIVQFCKMNGIVYSHFERWYKQDRVAHVVPVTIVDRDSLSVSPVDAIVAEESPSAGTNILIERFEIRFSNGLEIHHGEIDYLSFRSLVEKLEVLC